MEWFSRKTSIAGIQISNWMIVLGAVIVILLIYTSMQENQIQHWAGPVQNRPLRDLTASIANGERRFADAAFASEEQMSRSCCQKN